MSEDHHGSSLVRDLSEDPTPPDVLIPLSKIVALLETMITDLPLPGYEESSDPQIREVARGVFKDLHDTYNEAMEDAIMLIKVLGGQDV